jgi:hypothetical protein
MRSYNPSDKYDQEEVARLNAELWMVELLSLNPSYPHWGPREDYMWRVGRDEPEFDPKHGHDPGWEARVLCDSWKQFGPLELNDYNEIVHFYFELDRDSVPCETCGGTGYHPDAMWVSESFYRHSSPFTTPTLDEVRAKALMASFGGGQTEEVHGRNSFPSIKTLAKYGPEFRAFCESMQNGDGCWHDKITQDEVQALADAGRLTDYGATGKWNDGQWKTTGSVPTAAEVNAGQNKRGLHSHDGINRSILIERRLERLGIPKTCNRCDGHGHQYTKPKAHVNLILWLLHPRKGCSRGVEIKNIQQSDLPAVYKFLRQAAERNAERFSKIPSA